jgi:hypothetical protein
MSGTFRSLGFAVLAMSVAAAASSAPVQSAGAGRAAAPPAGAAAHSVAGTLEKYDASANTIIVNTGKGTETLSLSSDSSIRMGAARMAPADLTAHTGQKVKVRYSDANGQRMVQTLQLEGSPARAARAQTPAKK